MVKPRVTAAVLGVWSLSHAVQGWLYGPINLIPRSLLFAVALLMITGGAIEGASGIAVFMALPLFCWMRKRSLAGRG